MPFIQQFIMVFASFLLLAIVLYMVAKRRLQLRYALLWLALSLVMIGCALIPGPLFGLAHLLGFNTSSNFIFVLGVLFLLIIALALTAIASKQAVAIKNTVQCIAILEREIEDMRRSFERLD